MKKWKKFSLNIKVNWIFIDIFYSPLIHRTIYLEIENEMKLELGISPDDRSDDYLSYQTYESGLRTALERFKSS